MDYWKKWTDRKMKAGSDKERILLVDEHEEDKVLSISSTEFGSIKFMEECDKYYSIILRPKQAIEALEEAIVWIKEQTHIKKDYKVIYEDEICGMESHTAAAEEAFRVIQKISGANFEVINLATGSKEMVYCETNQRTIESNNEYKKEAEDMFCSMINDLRDNHFAELNGHRKQNDLTQYGVENLGTVECKGIDILYAGNGPTAKFQIITNNHIVTGARLMFQAFGKPIYKDLHGKDLEMIKQEFHEVIHGH